MIRRTLNKVPNNHHSLNSFRQLISQFNSNKLKHITLARQPSPFSLPLLPSPQNCKRNRLFPYVTISKSAIRSEIHQKGIYFLIYNSTGQTEKYLPDLSPQEEDQPQK